MFAKSFFTPLNISNDSKKLDEEEESQTRELQVEQGFKIFQEALSFQKEGNFNEADLKYKQLFKLDILRNADSVTPNVKTLRYLVHKNRGFLRLSKLKKEQTAFQGSNLDIEKRDSPTRGLKKELIGSMEDDIIEEEGKHEAEYLFSQLSLIVQDFTDSLHYADSDDDTLVEALFEIFVYFSSPRLARILLEYLFISAKSDLNVIGMNIQLMPPSMTKLIKKFNLILESIYDVNVSRKFENEAKINKIRLTIEKLYIKIENNLSFFEVLKEHIDKTKRISLENIKTIELEPQDISFTSLIDCVEEAYDNSNRFTKNGFSKQRFNINLHLHVDPLLSGEFDSTDIVKILIPENCVKVVNEESKKFLENHKNSSDIQRDITQKPADAKTSEIAEAVKESSLEEPTDSAIAENQNDSIGNEFNPDKNNISEVHRRSRHRSSKRVKELETQVSFKDLLELDTEFGRFNIHFQKMGFEDEVLKNIVRLFLEIENKDSENFDSIKLSNKNLRVWVQDFNASLNSWDRQKSSIILGLKSDSITASNNSAHEKKKNSTNPSNKATIENSVMDILKAAITFDAFAEKSDFSDNQKEDTLKVQKVENIVRDFVNDINNENFSYNIYQFRFEILSRIMGNNDDFTLINEYKFENQENFILNIRKYIDYYETYIINNIHKVFVSNSNEQDAKIYLDLGLSIAEVITDEYITLIANIRKTENLSSRELNEKTSTKTILEARITRWMELIVGFTDFMKISTKQWLRFAWCLFLYKQSAGRIVCNFFFGKQHIRSLLQKEDSMILEEIMRHVSELNISININYCNYKNFPKLNSITISDFAKKTNVLKSFFKVVLGDAYRISVVNFDSDDTSIEISNSRLERCIKLLNLVLSPFPDIETMTADERLIFEFVKLIPFEFSSKLHKVILGYYYEKIMDGSENTDIDFKHLFQVNFNRSLSDISSFLNSSAYLDLNESTRQLALLKVLTYFADISDKLVNILRKDEWVCYEEITSNIILQLAKILGILDIYYLKKTCVDLCSYIFPFLEASPRTARQIENFIVNTYIIFYIFLKSLLSRFDVDRDYIDIVSNIHGILGFIGICGNSNGVFLELLKHELLNVTNIYVDLEIYQAVHCQYHLPLTTEYFKPFDHKTKSILVDRASALELVPTFLKLSFEKRDPYFSSIKNDLKSIIDTMYECIGDPNMKYERIMRADAILENFLDNSLTPEMFRKSFHGLLDLQIQPSRLDIQNAVNHGLYYVEGAMALVLFQIRKRSMQGRSAELDFVIKMFKFDIICGTNRLESWILLGLSYTYLVEDDLIWTADKLNGEKKNTTSILQKKALLCFLMAISIYSKMSLESRSQSERMIYTLWSCLSKEMYSSIFQPMDKYAYLLSTKPRFFLENDKPTASHFGPVIDHVALLKTSLLLFQKAAKLKRNDWVNYYYISKLQLELGFDMHICIQSMLLACVLAKKYASTYSDIIIEPHYALVSMIYKASKISEILLAEVINYIDQDHEFLQFDFDVETRKKLLDKDTSFDNRFKLACILFIELNKKFLLMDKKKWHHQPRYRIAEIYMNVFKDNKKAMEEMSNLVSIKSHNKNLVSIWKPDSERPGMHFVFTYNYVKMYVDLLCAQGHFSSLCLLIKRLRRFGSGMHKMIEIWEYSCHKACLIVRERLNITNSFTDAFLIRSVFKEFVSKSEDFLTKIKDKGAKFLDKRLLLYLYDLSEIRRMNNGFAPTAEIDDTFGAIYLKLYVAYAGDKWDSAESSVAVSDIDTEASQEGTPIPESPSTPTIPKSPGKGGVIKTKVARRDMYPRAISILKILAKQIEELHKENEFIFDFDIKNKVDENIEKCKNDKREDRITELDKIETKQPKQNKNNQLKNHESESIVSNKDTKIQDKDNITSNAHTFTSISKNEDTQLENPEKGDENCELNAAAENISEFNRINDDFVLENQRSAGIHLLSSSSNEESDDGIEVVQFDQESDNKRKLIDEEAVSNKKHFINKAKF